MDSEHFRLVNVTVAFLIMGTLMWRHHYNWERNGLDNRLRSAAAVLEHAVLAVGSGMAYSLHVVAPPYVQALTVALCLVLLTLWTPWRWRLDWFDRT